VLWKNRSGGYHFSRAVAEKIRKIPVIGKYTARVGAPLATMGTRMQAAGANIRTKGIDDLVEGLSKLPTKVDKERQLAAYDALGGQKWRLPARSGLRLVCSGI